MKTIFTLLLSSLFSISLFAYDGTRLTISSVSNTQFRVEIDGRSYKMDNKSVSLRDLYPGYHTVKIFADKKKNNGWFNNRPQLVYSQSVNLKRGYHLDITVNRFGKAFVDERLIGRNDDFFDDDDDYYDNDNRDRHDHPWDEQDGRYGDTYNKVMSPQDFAQVKSSLSREWFENSRVSSAKLILDRNYFTAQQVKEILQLFGFENNKLDLAKYAYEHTVDKNAYYIVGEVFSFSSSKAELNNYIRDYRN